MALKAIPTVYSGIEFRSRLEADWAAYFDSEGIIWAYESEGYALSNGARYLPDFYLSELQIFVECRGSMDRSLRRPALFLKEAGCKLLLALPQGRFFLAKTEDSETGEPTDRFIQAMFDSDENAFKRFQQKASCLVKVSEDAIGYPHVYFENYGDSSPEYCGNPPMFPGDKLAWFNTMNDRSRSNGGDARSYYWGGYSTWQQRGFVPKQWMPKAKTVSKPSS